MPRPPAKYRHTNDTDTLYLSVYTDGAWTGDGVIVGDHSAEPTKYVFTGLVDDTVYEVRIRAGASPVSTDRPIAVVPLEDSAGVATLLTRITDTIQTKAQADTDQAAVLGAIAGNSLTGPNEVTITVVDLDTSEPIEGARVRLYRTGYTGTKYTGVAGETAAFTVDDATWSIAVTASGYTGANDVIVVPDELAKAISLTALALPPSDDPDIATLRITCYDETTQTAPGAIVRIRMCAAATGIDGASFDAAVLAKTADANGLIEVNVFKTAIYQIQRGESKNWEKVVIGVEDNQYVPSFLGVD